MEIKEKGEGKLGKKPSSRKPEELLKRGLINLDKPSGHTSHQVTHWVKRILKVKKVGHGGTLDPNATGVLPLGLGKSTKLLKLLLKEEKEYVGLVILHEKKNKKKVGEALEFFKGTITQIPPEKSSVKRRERKREIYGIELIEKEGRNVLFRVECEAGTYIRKLASSLGEKLGTKAHLKELRRTKVGPFRVENSVSLYDLEDAYQFWKEDGKKEKIKKCILPIEFLVKDLPKIYVFDSAARTLAKGTPLYVPGVSKLTENIKKGDEVALMTLKGELIGLGKSKMNIEEIMKREEGKVSSIDSVVFDLNKKQ